jgi:hypothetical protein
MSALARRLLPRPCAPGPRAAVRWLSARPAHQVLGVAPDATPAEAKRAFKRLALIVHPDVRGTGCATRYHEARAAMEAMAAGGGAGGSGLGRHAAGPDWSDAARAEAEAEAREYAEHVAREERRRREERGTAEDRADATRWLRLLLGYIFLGTCVKVVLMNVAAEARESELARANGWVPEGRQLRPKYRARDEPPSRTV